MISLCRQRSISLLTVALTALPLLFACSDDSASGPGFEGGGGRGGRDSGVPIAPRMDQGVTTPDQTQPELKESRSLRVDGESRRAFSYGERLELAVFYVGIVPGMGEQPLSNQRISMRMLDRMGNDQTGAGTASDGQGRPGRWAGVGQGCGAAAPVPAAHLVPLSVASSADRLHIGDRQSGP